MEAAERKPRMSPEKKFRYKKLAEQALAVLFILVLFYGSIFALQSYHFQPPQTDFNQKFVDENLGRGALVTLIAITVVLGYMQKNIFWITRSKRTTYDERQLAVRQRVFEISHKVGAVSVLLFVWAVAANRLTIIQELSKPFTSSAFLIPVWGLVVFLFALPSLLAAWYKDAE